MEIIVELTTKNLYLNMFKVPIYDSKVCLVQYKNDEGYNEALEFCTNLGMKIDEYKEDGWNFCYGFTFKDRIKYGYVHFIFFNISNEYKEDYINTLSHENVHLIQNISKHHSLQNYKNGDNEHIAYLTGYLFDILYKIHKMGIILLTPEQSETI